MTLNESLELIKFRYNKKGVHTRNPRVIVLDDDYPGIVGQKDYGKTRDILAVKLNDFKGDRKMLQDRIERIYSLDLNKLDKYLILSQEVKDALPCIRRYKRKHMSHVKRKGKYFYHNIKEA